jgi:hypothetical protein
MEHNPLLEPCPWQIFEEDGDDCDPPEPGKRWLAICNADGEELAVIVNRIEPPTKDQWALAALLMSAPELVSALRNMIAAFGGVDRSDSAERLPVIEQARSALKKAGA